MQNSYFIAVGRGRGRAQRPAASVQQALLAPGPLHQDMDVVTLATSIQSMTIKSSSSSSQPRSSIRPTSSLNKVDSNGSTNGSSNGHHHGPEGEHYSPPLSIAAASAAAGAPSVSAVSETPVSFKA